MNRKARALLAREAPDARAYAFSDCCPTFAPGWEVGFDGSVDPCGFADVGACHAGCSWASQIPDQTTYPGWLDNCASPQKDWRSLCVVPD